MDIILDQIEEVYEDIQRIQIREDSLNILENTPQDMLELETVYQEYRQQFSKIYFEMSLWYVGDSLVGSSKIPLTLLFGFMGFYLLFKKKR